MGDNDNGIDPKVEDGDKQLTDKELEELRVRERFGHILLSIRKILGMSIEELARAAEMDAGYISRLENGHRSPPSAKILRRLADVLKVNVMLFFMAADYLRIDERGNSVTKELLDLRVVAEVTGTHPVVDVNSEFAEVIALLKEGIESLKDIKFLLTTAVRENKEKN